MDFKKASGDKRKTGFYRGGGLKYPEG